MLRRPKVQFKPKISTGSESKPVQEKSRPVKKSAPIIPESDPVSVSDFVAIERNEVSVDANLLVPVDPAAISHPVVIEPRQVPLINIPPLNVPPLNVPPSLSVTSTSPTKRTRGSKTTIEIVDEDNDSATSRRQSNSQKHSSSRQQSSRQSSGQSPRKRPKICLSSSKQNLPLDRSKVTMYDLLSYNPPLSEEQKERRRREREEVSASDSEEQKERGREVSVSDSEEQKERGREVSVSDSDRDEERSSVDEQPFKVPSPLKSVMNRHKSPPSSQQSVSECDGSELNESSNRTGPRVKIGADGNIVIDEESLIVKRVDTSVNEVTVINEGKVGTSSTNYESFRKRKTTRNRWTEDETVKFYHALSAIGTDFSLMADTFFRHSRTREELRNKFKKEEKTKTHLIDSAMAQTNLKYATDYLEKVNKSSPSKLDGKSQHSSPSKLDGKSQQSSPSKLDEKSQQSSPANQPSSKQLLSPTRKSPRNVS